MVIVRGDTPLDVIVIVEVPGAGGGEGEGGGVGEAGVEFSPPHPVPITTSAAMLNERVPTLTCAQTVDRSTIFRRTFWKC
jgi:hypothetical protein